MIFIDSDDYKASGIETLFFPGGEPHAKVPEFQGVVILYLKLRTWNDVGLAACVLSALSMNASARVFVGLMYAPGARQDRAEGAKYPLTVQLIGNMLYRRNMKYFIFDPHSSKLGAFITHTKLDFTNLSIPIKPNVVGIIAPDEGSRSRASAFREWFYPKARLLECTKVRDPETGTLSNYIMPALPTTGRYIIVDDICDGGGTFNLLVNSFKQDQFAAASALELFVSHGVFSKGLVNINYKIEHITTTDSWCVHKQEDFVRLTVLPLADLLKQAVALSCKD